MSGGTNLVVPVVLWGKSPPTHCVSCVYLSRDQSTLITGCYDGQICLWQVDPETLKMTPRCLLVGHTAPILCLSKASVVLDNNFVVSSSENGEMCTWDLVDGKCRELAKLPYVHTSLQAYHMEGTEDARLFCNGYYADVLVMDPFSLEVIFTLSSKVSPDWISALHVLRPNKRKDDVVLALTTTGTVKMWTLSGTESKTSDPIFENESKQIRCLNALAMSCCTENQRTVLIVTSKYWQIYDAGDFSVLCSVMAAPGERWLSGHFLCPDRVLVWSDEGKGYIYKLPANSVADNKDFHTQASNEDTPFLYCLLEAPSRKPVCCPPAMRFVEKSSKGPILIRADSEGSVIVWAVPQITNAQLAQIRQQPPNNPTAMGPIISTSIAESWAAMKPPPVGILDQLESGAKLTASIYLPQQGRLVVGRDDGTIVIVPATQTVMLQLLHGNHQQYDDWPPHQMLVGHSGRVNSLLYPYHVHPRYDKSHLVSGGVDFAVCLWDLYASTLLHRFCVHAGEITQLLVPPNTCSPRVLECICSVASDHSVTLLSLTKRKCIVLASRHLFPVVNIKWRPLDDFMIVGCSDGTVYVWQMETGHLDRVLHGINAEEVMYACDENTSSAISGESGLANPAVHFFRGLRHRNISAIRHATQRGLHQLQQLSHHNHHHGDDQQKPRAFPLMIQGLRTNPKDPESHILCFDIEALIVELLSEEYSAMSPGTLEAHGLINASEYQKVAALTTSASPDAQKKIADFFGKMKNKAGDMERMLKEKDKHGIIAKMKEGAENMQTKLHAKAEIVGFKPISSDSKGDGNEVSRVKVCEANLMMELCQLLLSLLHAWGLDPHLDLLCESKLGLLRPLVPVSFGVISKAGYMSLLLPTWQLCQKSPPSLESNPSGGSSLSAQIPPELVELENATRQFTSTTHWELSTSVTTNHLLAIVALANTLMSMNNASFVAEQERNRKLMRQNTIRAWGPDEIANEETVSSQIKQGWCLLATLHCVLLPDKVAQRGSKAFKRPRVEMMASRWQHHCLEVREAAQALLLAELTRLGAKGRKALVDHWAQYLPMYNSNETQNTNAPPPLASTPNQIQPQPTQQPVESNHPQLHEEDEFEDEEMAEELYLRKPSSAAELKRKQTTAVVLLGVIGSEFGQDVGEKKKEGDQRRKSSIIEGFGIGNNNLARLTSLALTYLLLTPPSNRLPAHTPLRRAAIDLIGRGFTVWEPYIDVSKVLLGLLELCCDADKLIPSMTYGLPLTPAADSARTARHALTLIATVRPAAFITTMAREVARYNTLQQNAQTLNVNLSNAVLHRAKPEILRCVELLIEKMHAEMADLLVEVVDVILHCVESGHLKVKCLSEVFPAICRFNQVSHCPSTRRIAVGAKFGTIALYELRSSKCQTIKAHDSAITANAFSPDGKYLVSYSCGENKLSFWQTSTGMFGLGNSQTKRIKTYSTSPVAEISRLNPMRAAKLVWISNRTVILMLADGSETRFNV
ncbi:WD repeat-containing protein 7 isoform X2 [Cimex lectularius]|uniref:WDR72-like alpha-solenoid domain-containing protein n=1 Tax=Cimex lectularius TaxID=79782 RepID=A0A8I6S064_CIMLE|nr:WD repeat-containing protein 7 isoform X2 [Cimex lectularius]